MSQFQNLLRILQIAGILIRLSKTLDLDLDSSNSMPLTSTIQLPVYGSNEPPRNTTPQNMTPSLSQNMTPTSFPITVPNTINSAVIPKQGRKPLSDKISFKKLKTKKIVKPRKLLLSLLIRLKKLFNLDKPDFHF